MKRKVLLSFLILLCSLQAKALDGGKIKGVLWDTLTNKGIGSATLTVFRMSDSSIMNFSLSGNTGVFEVNKLPLNTELRLLVSHVNYETYRKHFTLTEEKPEIDLDTLQFSHKIFEMEGVVVTGDLDWDRPPIVVRGDTVSFHADAFLNRPGTVVEDLLKRIPGIEFTSEGITMNGRKVSRILLDGREFFGSDPTMLLKNIPAMMIDAVEVTEEKDEFGNLSESGNVTINVTLKPGAKKGSFGKVFGGYGTTERYETGLLWNIFRDTMQVSFVGYANNLSKSGFSYSDLYNLGGFSRQSFNRIMFSGNSVTIGNTSFGGGEGITESFGGGINFSHVLFKKAEVSLSYFNGNVRTSLSNSSIKQYLLSDSGFTSTSDRTAFDRGMTHNYNGRIHFKIDTTSTMFYKVEGAFSSINNRGNQNILNLAESSGFENTITNELRNRSRNSDYSGILSYNKMFNKKLSMYLRNSHRFNQQSGTDLYNQLALMGLNVFEEQSFEQNRNSQIKAVSQSSTGRVTYKWNKEFRSEVEYNFHTNNQTNTTEAEQKPVSGNEFNRVGLLSGLYNSKVESHLFRKNFNYNKNKLNLSGSLGYNVFNLYANESDRIQTRQDIYQRPVVFLWLSKRWDNASIGLSFNQNYREPSIQQMIPILNNVNPRFISTGNYLLEPYFSHEINNSGYWSIKKIGLNLSIYTNINWMENPVISNMSYDELGREINTFQNYAGGIGLSNYNNFGINKKLKLNEKWNMPLGVSFNGGINRNYQLLFSELNEINSRNIAVRPSLSVNKMDVIEFRVAYTRRKNINEASLTQTTTSNLFHSVNSSFWIQLPKGFSMEYEYDFNYQPFIQSGIENGFNLMNISLNKSVLKDNKGVIKLSVFDLFSQNMDFGRIVTQNYIEEYRTNAVVRYIMLSFVYNANSMSAAEKTRAKGREIRWW
jgi:hypothetical protein